MLFHIFLENIFWEEGSSSRLGYPDVDFSCENLVLKTSIDDFFWSERRCADGFVETCRRPLFLVINPLLLVLVLVGAVAQNHIRVYRRILIFCMGS